MTINYPGSGNFTSFTYDGMGNRVKIVETTGGAVTSTKQFIFAKGGMCEVRDAAGSNVVNRFFDLGESISGNDYFFTLDHQSVCELSDASANIQAQYRYDPFGVVTKVKENIASDFQYMGYLIHSRSGLKLTLYRAYDSALGRWLSRDPIGEQAGSNLFAFVLNDPPNSVDLDGLDIYLKRGNAGSPAFTVNRYIHESICVDTWDGCCNNQPGNFTGTSCFGFYLSGFQLRPPSWGWLRHGSWNLGGPLQGTVTEEDPGTNFWIIRTKHTDCKQDKAFLDKLTALKDTTDTYSGLRHNCITFAEMMFDSAPGSE